MGDKLTDEKQNNRKNESKVHTRKYQKRKALRL